MELLTWVFHPNLNEEGKICCCVLGLRNEDSRAPYQTIIKILNINLKEIKKSLGIDYCIFKNIDDSQVYTNNKVKYFKSLNAGLENFLDK